MQHRDVTRRPAKGHVGMPPADAEEPAAIGLLAHLQHLGEAVRVQHPFVRVMHEERSETGREVAKRRRRQVLVMEDEHEDVARARRGLRR